MSSTSTILLLCCIFITGQVTGQELLSTTEIKYYIPRDNWYSANLSPVSKVPVGVRYDSMSCSIIDSFVDAMMAGYTEVGVFTKDLSTDTKEAFNSCKAKVCENPELLEKLTDPLVAAELASVMATLMEGSLRLPELHLFRYVVDPTYWEIIKDIPFPVVEESYFYEQNEAAFEIISKVCGHQKQTLKAKLNREVVSWIFLDILIDEYIPGAFTESDKEELATETDAFTIADKWISAESRRSKHNVCLDLNVAYSSERRSISRIRDIATKLGVKCGSQEKNEIADDEGSSDYEEGSSARDEGSSDYAEGSSDYEEGSSARDEGSSDYGEGSSERDDGSSDYEEGSSDAHSEGKGGIYADSSIVIDEEDSSEYEYLSFEFSNVGAAPGSSITSNGGPPPSTNIGGGSGPPPSGIVGK